MELAQGQDGDCTLLFVSLAHLALVILKDISHSLTLDGSNNGRAQSGALSQSSSAAFHPSEDQRQEDSEPRAVLPDWSDEELPTLNDLVALATEAYVGEGLYLDPSGAILPLVLADVDRIDSTLGYVPGNYLACSFRA